MIVSHHVTEYFDFDVGIVMFLVYRLFLFLFTRTTDVRIVASEFLLFPSLLSTVHAIWVYSLQYIFLGVTLYLLRIKLFFSLSRRWATMNLTTILMVSCHFYRTQTLQFLVPTSIQRRNLESRLMCQRATSQTWAGKRSGS